jgi:ribonuclease BN (tRNA processing enzyme)
MASCWTWKFGATTSDGALKAAVVVTLLAAFAAPAGAAETCSGPVAVQVLGSGGPELESQRASSSYLVWIAGEARVLVDIGGGAGLRFGESGARIADLDAILLTHLHADHTSDLPALVKSSWFSARTRPLPIFGPPDNRFFPSTVSFVRSLFDPVRGTYRYLGDVLRPLAKGGYKLQPYDVERRRARDRREKNPPLEIPAFSNERLRAVAVPVGHGSVPALAWRIEAGGKRIIFSGDTNGLGTGLAVLARDADIFVAHHAVPEDSGDAVALQLHMPPSAIGRIAHEAKVKQVVLSHRMLRTLGREEESLAAIRKSYAGPVSFADDLHCYVP